MCIRDSLAQWSMTVRFRRPKKSIFKSPNSSSAVSYTHLDVYKRQAQERGQLFIGAGTEV